jgi:hypothetical protein
VGPDLKDWYGNAMNQDRNGVNGQAADAFVETIRQTAPGSTDLLSVTGIPTSTVAGTAETITVTALGPGGGTDTGYLGTITFTSSDPQAGLPANYTFTATDKGTHTFTVTLKTAGTDESVTATDTSHAAIIGTEENLTVAPAAAHSLRVTGFPSPDPAYAANKVTVTAYDAYGNMATDYNGIVKLTSSDSKAILPASYAFGPADAGMHTFSVTLQTLGTQSITATDTGSSPLAGTESNITVTQTAASFTVNGFPTSDTADYPHSLTVTVDDAYGHVVTGYTGTVHFTSTDPRAILPADYTFTASDKGVHTFTGVVLETAGSQSITATDASRPSVTGSESGIAVAPAAAASLALTGFPNPDTVGTSHSLTVTAQDAYGNVATGYKGTVRLTSSDSQAVLPGNYPFTSSNAGVATVTGVVFNTFGSQSITATDTATSSITGGTTVTVNAVVSATFVGTDTTTQGTWIGKYGSDGYNVIGTSTSDPKYPSYAVVTASGFSTYTWSPNPTTDARGLQIPPNGSAGRIASVWYSATSFSIDVNLTDGQAHQLALYADDWDTYSRGETIRITSAGGGAVLDTEALTSFHGGAYEVWDVSGHIKITITRTGGLNAVLNGLFFSPATGTPSAPSPATASAAATGPAIPAGGIGGAGDPAPSLMGALESSAGGTLTPPPGDSSPITGVGLAPSKSRKNPPIAGTD